MLDFIPQIGAISRSLIIDNIIVPVTESMRNPLAVPKLMELLRHEKTKLRRAAALALGEIGAQSATDGLISALDDEDKDVRITVVQALKEIADPSAIDALQRSTSDGNKKVSEAAKTAIQSIKNRQSNGV